MPVDIEDYTSLVGKRFIPGDQTPQSPDLPKEKVILEQDLPLNYRVLAPNSFTTLEFIPDRLNLQVDKDNIVKSVNLG
ncbi:hypothetical protein HK097_002871 [Rhizophlyctis rosea]|uniref:Uncharacterized protein n=1 Tax=Rhizophlyctis rosea TaxID=64517 RepID=A0AAD5S5G6_9FUNG|nr:hypothetical protein HK097_002871 [Rhizophlyctis rosea]